MNFQEPLEIVRADGDGFQPVPVSHKQGGGETFSFLEKRRCCPRRFRSTHSKSNGGASCSAVRCIREQVKVLLEVQTCEVGWSADSPGSSQTPNNFKNSRFLLISLINTSEQTLTCLVKRSPPTKSNCLSFLYLRLVKSPSAVNQGREVVRRFAFDEGQKDREEVGSAGTNRPKRNTSNTHHQRIFLPSI